MSLFIGLMSGTSADGLDAALVDFSHGIRLLDALCLPYSDSFRHHIRDLAVAPLLKPDDIMAFDRHIAQHSVSAVRELLQRNRLQPAQITAIGSHGHTLRHKSQPDGYSWQAGDPSWIAEHTGITCISDFRRRDIAAGGEGAPLVPAFHQAVLHSTQPRMVLNIGGIANLTVLPHADQALLGFDTGPGNALMDDWCRLRLNCRYDAGGALAAQGQCRNELLQQWLTLDYFQRQPPKSTGRELFNLERLAIPDGGQAEDILTTLGELTAVSISRAVQEHGHADGELLVCGGGVHNQWLLQRLQQLLPDHRLASTASAGIDPDWLEAMAFAWLAFRTRQHLSGNAPAVTGAAGERILGGIYPA